MNSTKWNLIYKGTVKIYDIKWTIVNVKQLTANARDIESDIIDSLFQLKIKLVGKMRQWTEFYYTSLHPMYIMKGEIRSQSISYVVCDHRKYYTTSINTWNYMNVYEGDYLCEVHNDDRAELKIQIKFIEVKGNYRELATGASLNADIGKVLNNEMFSDVTIKSVEGNRYKAHKFVLARSATLLARIERKTAESHQSIIETELKSAVLEQLLMFMYTDTVPTVDENPEQLLAAADNYRLSRLKSICELSLQKKITISNAIDTLRLAYNFSAEELKKSTLKYIEDRASLVVKTEAWEKLDSLELVKTIHEYYMGCRENEPCSHLKGLPAEITISTEGCVKTYQICWTLPNIRQLLTDDTTREIHTVVNNSIVQLKIRLSGKQKRLIEFYFMLSEPVFFLNCALSISTNNYRWKSDFKASKKCESPKIHTWHYLGWLSSKELDYYTYDKSIRLNYNIEVTFINVSCSNINYAVPMSADFKSTLYRETFSDTLMRSADGDEYKVHKLILAARSSVLKACFEHNTSECHTNVIESPFDSEVLGEVITFLYTDIAPEVNEIPEKILVAADYYQLGRLKSLCELALRSKLTIDNAIDTLQLALKYSAHALKESTLNVIRDDLDALYTETNGWAQLKSVECVKLIHESVVASRDEW